MPQLICFSVCVWSGLKGDRSRDREKERERWADHGWWMPLMRKERDRMTSCDATRLHMVGRLALRSRTAPPAWHGLRKPGHWAGGGLGHWDRFRCRAPALGSVGSGGRWLAGRRRPYGGQVGTLAAATACTCSRSDPAPGVAPPLAQTSFLTSFLTLTSLFFPSPPCVLYWPTSIAHSQWGGTQTQQEASLLLSFPSPPPRSSFWVSHSFVTPWYSPLFLFFPLRSGLAMLHFWYIKAGGSVTELAWAEKTVFLSQPPHQFICSYWYLLTLTILLTSPQVNTEVDFREDNYIASAFFQIENYTLTFVGLCLQSCGLLVSETS